MTEVTHYENHPSRMVTIDEHSEGQRLDNFLMAQFRSLPKSRIYQMIRKGEVRINKGRAKPLDKLKIGDIVRLPPVRIPFENIIPIPLAIQESLLKKIILEDDHILVIDKPFGLSVHKGSFIDYGVIEIIRAARPDLEFIELVHRLDRDTSGILLLAKKGSVLRELQTASIDKYYQLIVQGEWLYNSPYSEKSLLDTEHRINNERHVIVAKNGKPSETEFVLIKKSAKSSFLEAKLITGRTHQIRVHCSHLGHPIFGEKRYTSNTMNSKIVVKNEQRLLLHAYRLQFVLNNQSYDIKSPFPLDITQFMESL